MSQTHLSEHVGQVPDDLDVSTPPEMPFEYLYPIAGLIDVQQIPPDDQGQVIAELRRWLKTEDDDVARNDILMLLKELRTRNEPTVLHAPRSTRSSAGSRSEGTSSRGGSDAASPEDH